MCFFKNFLKVSKKRFFDALQEFSKSSQNTGEKIFAKYLSADGCFAKTILLTVMITTLYLLPDTMALTFTRKPMKRNFT